MKVCKTPSEYDESKFTRYIRQRFPYMPEPELMVCVRQCISSKNPDNDILSLSKFISIQVKAHIRHRMTNYEALLSQGRSKYKARNSVKDRVEKIYKQWQGSHRSRLKIVSDYSRYEPVEADLD